MRKDSSTPPLMVLETVSAITEDANGIIWLGTDNGLYSYDGYHDYRHFAPPTPLIMYALMHSVSRGSMLLYGYGQSHPAV